MEFELYHLIGNDLAFAILFLMSENRQFKEHIQE